MDLAQRVKNYTPSSETVALIKTARITLLVGIAGAGKDTIKDQLLRSDDFRDIVSHTTRPPRENDGIPEVDGLDYNFIDIDTALKLVNEKAFVEVKVVHGDTLYGTSVAEIKAGQDEGKISITDVVVQGVGEYKQLSQDVVALFILPPNYETWRERLAKRYKTNEELGAEWPKRRDSAIKELEFALSVPYYHFIINDDLERSVRIAGDIAHKPDSFRREDDEARLVARDILEELKSRL